MALTDINNENCASVARDVDEIYGTTTLAIATDVANEPAVADIVNQVLSAFGRIDILIIAAATKSLNYFRPLSEYYLEDGNQVMAVNLTGMFLCTKHVVPHFIDQKRGNIINIASIYGVVGPSTHIREFLVPGSADYYLASLCGEQGQRSQLYAVRSYNIGCAQL